VPNGFVNAAQLRAIADLAERHARGVADVTVRQNFQLHWVSIEALPDIVRSLEAVGITTIGTCGDVTRNLTGCPVAGIDRDEIADASAVVRAATDRLNGSPDFYNLPRKYKVSISGCRAWCTYPEINDVGLTAIRHALVLVATGTDSVAARVYRDARRAGVLVNAADDPARCDFRLPALLRRGRLTVAVSTGGASPALATVVRDELERLLPDSYAPLLEVVAAVCARVRRRAQPVPAGRWREALDDRLRALVAGGRTAAATALLARRLAG
jgi:siroheme synthase (precorrin-2 oxidase/ferrochelatase)